MTLTPGVGLKKKGEDEVSTDEYRIYGNDINRLLPKCVAKMAGYSAKFFFCTSDGMSVFFQAVSCGIRKFFGGFSMTVIDRL